MQYPQHPWQSWRDRWIKQLKGRPRPFPLPNDAPPTPPSDAPVATGAAPLAARPKVSSKAAPRLKSPEKRSVTKPAKRVPATSQSDASTRNATADRRYILGSFDDDDAEILMEHAEDIIEVIPENISAAWETWAHVSMRKRITEDALADSTFFLGAQYTYSSRLADLLGRSCASQVPQKEGQAGYQDASETNSNRSS